MKKIFCLLLLLSIMYPAISQSTLSPVAAILFKNVKTTLTVADKNKIAGKLGFVTSGNKENPLAQDKDSKEYPFSATVLPVDMNKDGKEEIFVSFGNSYTSGNTGSSICLFIRSTAGEFTDNLGFPGTVPEALTTVNKDYPDLLIGGPGFEFPVWRWNGKNYALFKKVNDRDYEKLKRTSIDEMSKTYQKTLP